MVPPERSAQAGALAIQRGWESYRAEFRRLTRRAGEHFESKNWRAAQEDAARRLELYQESVAAVRSELRELFGDNCQDAATWRAMKPIFGEAIVDRGDADLAQTYFNSVTRHVLVTVGVDASVEFVDFDPRRTRYGPGPTILCSYPCEHNGSSHVAQILADHRWRVPFRDEAADIERTARALETEWAANGGASRLSRIDLIESVFYRGTGAYLIGRALGHDGFALPVILVLIHGNEGIEVDAVLLSTREFRIVFSFTRSHFLIDAERPSDLASLLSDLMPGKPIAEIYISLGHPKHGKTELYRDLYGHLRRSMDRFEHAPGDTGMVMIVFGLSAFDYVFKVIRDEFAPPKKTSREHVQERYELVFRHDRAGRLIEAQEFEHLSFERWRFAPALLEELKNEASLEVTVTKHEVSIARLYVERRVRPLNLFLREASQLESERAVDDYGQAIRDLAQTNIFPGDLLLKNFGVTRQGRVTFYDYDEICLMTECVFRDLPAARSDAEETASEPWYYVGEHDVFPEEFIHFLGLPKPLRERFQERHADILTAGFWRELQTRHQAGEVIDVFPYATSRRLRPAQPELESE